MYRVTVTADYETEAEAEAGLSAIEEAVGKSNGNLEDSDTYDLEGTD